MERHPIFAVNIVARNFLPLRPMPSLKKSPEGAADRIRTAPNHAFHPSITQTINLMKTRLSIFTASLTGASLLAAALFASAQQNSPATPPVDPAHAAHVAAGTMPPDAPAGDPALTKQLAELQAKVTQLQASLAKGAPPATAAPMPGMPAATPSAAPAPPMAMGMGKMKPGGMPGMKAGAAPARPMAGMSGSPAPAAGGMGMMGMMDKMMGMMDKMMGMGGGAAMPPAAPMAGMGMMDMDDQMEMPPMGGAMPPGAPAPAMNPGMGMDSMEMAGMMGMSPMGGGSPAAMAQSALPGFPGASHLYHIGATGFYLDHPQHIALTLEQQAGLNQAKQQAAFAKSTADLAAAQVEQELWMMTAADQPDAAKIEAKIRENEKIRGDERLAFIRAVGEASKLLTDEQRKSLTGFAPPAPAPAAAPMAAPSAAMPAGGMPDM